MKNLLQVNRALVAKKTFTNFKSDLTGMVRKWYGNGSINSRLDSLSIVSRQSDLRTYRAKSSCETFSVGQCSPHAFPFEAKSQLASSHQSDLDYSHRSDLRYSRATLALLSRFWKYVAMIFAVLTLSIANIGMAWGAYTPTADEVIVLNSVYNASATGSGYSNHSAIAWGGTGSTNSMKAGDPSNNGAATSGNVTCYSVKGNGKGKNITVSITGCSKIIVYHQNHSSRYVRLHENDKDGTVIGSGAANTYYTEVNLTPATTYTIFLEGWTGSAQTDFYVYAVKLIKGGSSCAAADLAAADITSNGDQIVGTGITFSKVGSPASGDTWYWQTSATGTDKTYNASSPYTTATTAGSYTVYLRAYNTAADCWGKAIGKTNTIISCPFDVYNGENVDKGNATASGWTINNSTNMAKTSGSSNGYSYWYQAGSSSSYVQFDGSMSLVSGDKIKIQWTHTNGSNKTLQLTINGSLASLTSGSQANSSNLVEAVYDVTSAITVTSIKLNSSGSSGCIIYQVSIVKAACDDEPSCSAPTSPSISGTTSYTEGDDISLTASAKGTSGTTTYQWYKGDPDNGGVSQGAASTGGATFSKTSCVVGDAGTYYCVISNGTGCTAKVSKTITVAAASSTYYYRGEDNSWGATPMTPSAGGTYEYYATTRNNHQFKIALSADGWDYNYTYVDAGFYGTTSNIGDYSSNNCYVWSAPANYYIVVFKPNTAINTTNNPKICATTSNTLPKDQFTISFNSGSGSGSMSSITNINAGSNQAVTANSFSAPSGYQFAGWKANVDVKVGGSTQTAGTVLADGVTIQSIVSDITLTAQWELIPTYNVVYNANGGTGTTASQTGNLSGAQVTTRANGFTKTGYKFKWWNTAANGSGEDFYPGEKVTIASADVNLYAQWEQVSDGWEFWCGSPNAFTTSQAVVGDMVLTAGGGSTTINTGMEADATIVSKYNSSVDKHAICIAVASNDQYVQVSFSDGSPINSLKLWATTNQNSSKKLVVIYSTTADFSSGQYEAKEVSVPANNASSKAMTDFSPATTDKYFYARIYRKVATAVYGFTGGSGNTARIYGVKAQKGANCTAPSALAAATPTAKGITLSVTDANNVNNYEFYVSTSSTAPEAGATATHSVSSAKSLTITNLVAGTTYYAWARSVCGVSNKSGWTALTGNTFTTSTVNVDYHLTNVTKTSGAATAGGSTFTAVFAAVSGYSMPTPTVTIGGNAATSGTDYTWSSGTLTINADKINGDIDITLTSTAAAPTNVAISGEWLYFAGETITLTATPTGGNGPVTYQWYKGGKADGNAISGATSATFTKTCAFEDAGSYYCKVTCGGSASTWGQNGDAYDVKIPRLYVKTGHNYDLVKTDYGNVDFTRATASTATASISLGSNWDYCFNIADGCGHYYGNAGTMQYNNYGPWVTNVNNQDCGLRTTNGATYVFTINYSNWTQLTTTVTFPVGNQAAGKVIYFDNNVLNWTGSSIYYRIGHATHSQYDQMSLVHGTANLYQMTTREYNNFMGWFIANAQGGSGSGKSIYNTVNSPAITKATAHEGGAVTQAAVTVTPTTSRGNGEDVGINDNCEFFNYTIVSGMKTQNVSITAPENGTITVSYTDVNNAAQSFTSGNRDLAHTVIITPTATPATGYQLSGLTVNGNAHTPEAPYTVTGPTIVAATFSLIDYTVTLHTNGGTINAGNVTSYNYGTGATLPTNVTRAGYTFDGWYDNSGLTGDAVTTIPSSATGNKEFWAKWTCVTPTFETNLSTTTVNYNAGASASALTVAATAGGGTVSYQWYSNTANSTTTPTPTALTTGASYTPSTAASGTTYYFCVATNSTAGCSTTATSNITPVVVAATYTVTYNYNGATSGASPASETASSVTLPTPTRTDYILDGWYTTAGTKVGAGGATYNPTADITLYARWETACTAGSSTTLVDINFTNKGNSTSYSAGNTYTLDGTSVYFKNAMSTHTDGSYLNLPGNATTSSNYMSVPLANINGEITITVTHNNTRPQWKHNFTGLNAAATSSNLSTNPSSMSDNTRPGSNTTTSTWTISTNKSYGVFYIGKGSNGTSQFKGLTITTPGSGTCYHVYYCGNGATSGYVSDTTSYAANDDPVVLGNVGRYPFVRAGYTFTGWNTEAGGGGTAYAAGATITDISADVTLYAQWTPTVNYSVTHSLTNVTATSGATGASAATIYTAYNAVFAAESGYNLPSTITVTIGGETATAGTAYTWDKSTGALTINAAYVTGNIVITIAGEVAEDCEELFATEASDKSTLTVSVGSQTTALGSNGGDEFSAGGYSYSVKPNSSNGLIASPKEGSSFAAGDSLIVVVYNNQAGAKTMGFKLGSGTYTASVASKTLHIFRQTLTAADINGSGKVTFNRQSSDDRWVEIIIKKCGLLPTCTTPIIPSLSDQTVCPGGNPAAWNATQTASLQTGETASYSWKKKGSETVLATTASFDVSNNVTEGQAGTYVVTVTVSALGKASSSASKEVNLSVTAAVEEPVITANKAKVYAGDQVIFTATCGTAGVTWQWYRCTNAAGSQTGSCLSTTSSYTLASAPSAGTYYYKAIATGSCGSASTVYTLVVSAANACDKEFWFAKEADRPTGAAAATHITGCPSGSSSASYTASIDGTNYALTGSTGQKTGNITIVVPADNTGTLYVVVQGSSSRTLTLSKGGTQIDQQTPTNSVWGVYTFSDLEAGTYNLVSSGNISWSVIALKLCPTVSCTDDTPTATATNTTVCAGGTITITATGYETGATFQWQKQNASTNAWEDIDGATSATYTVATAAAEHAGNYQIVTTKTCARTSNTVTIAVPSAPVFNSFTATRSIMATLALSISDVEATDAVSYKWYKSANNTWEATDDLIGETKNLVKAYAGETAGSTYYLFCQATNSCGTTTSGAIRINVTAYVEEDCATKGNEGEAGFGFENTGCSNGSLNSTSCYTSNSRSKYLTYTAPEGKYFNKAIVTVAVSSGSKCGYAYSTDGSTWTYAELSGLSGSLTEKTINLTGNITHFRISRNLQDGNSKDWGVTSGTFYLAKACFEYAEACTATTVTPSASSPSHTIGNAFTEPTFTVKHGNTAFSPQPTLTYSSSDEDIATVDDEGAVSFQNRAGTVVITASYAGDATYCASSGSYTITVSCSDEAPKIVAASGTNLSGCNTSVTLNAKKQNGSDFSDGTFQWFRDGEVIAGATGSSYTANRAGIYTVERTSVGGCTSPSSNKAKITSTDVEPDVERLVPFHYYHVNKTYTDQMKMRHLFAVKYSGTKDGKNFDMTLSRNSGAATNVTSSNSFSVIQNADHSIDTVMIDLNRLNGKYAEGDTLVLTCSAIDCQGNVSATYRETITIYVIGATPTLALICSGANGDGTRKTDNLVVGGDFLTGYNKADLCVQTGGTSFDKTQEWGLYTELKEEYIVKPVNGYANFNKLNYEPFDILFLTDYPKASKSDAAATILDDMYELVDFRPLFSFKTHMVHKTPSKWASKGFTTEPVADTKNAGKLNLNIVCYAHPMFDAIKTGEDVYTDVDNVSAPLVYKMLSGEGYEKNKGMQGFEVAAAENFVTIGLTHHDATITYNSPNSGDVTWSTNSGDRMLVSVAERQTNVEARMILFSLNAGAHSKLTDKGEQVVLACLRYLLDSDPLHVADCSFTFDNGASNEHDAAWYSAHCSTCTGTKGDHKWSTAANWAPDYRLLPGEFTSVHIAAPVEVDLEHAHVMSVRIKEGGSVEIPAGKALDVKSTVRHLDGWEISPTENSDIFLGSTSSGNGTLIFNNDKGDSKATVAMYSKAKKESGKKRYQYIGSPFVTANALYNYYGSWIYAWTGTGWTKVPTGGTVTAWTGYCITQESEGTVYVMNGQLASTENQDIAVGADQNMVVGNSWTAPIDINAFEDTDLENLLGNIYFFNTGVDATGTAGAASTRYQASTYVTVPIHAAPYTGDDHIPSLQGFFVKSNGAAGVLHLDYSKHVRGTTRDNILSGQMHAPRRAKAGVNEPAVLEMLVSGTNYDDKLILLERDDFSEGFDNGWDGEKWDGNEAAMYLYTMDSESTEQSVTAVPDLEGMLIGFRAGEEDNAYTMHFDYKNAEEPIYLLDTDNNTYTLIETDGTYHFQTTDKEKHNRFVLTRRAPQIATGVDNVQDDNGAKAVKFIKDDKLYIFMRGVLYDATGKVVK